MRPRTSALVAFLGLGLCAGSAFADPFKPESVPAGTQWVIHVDADVLNNSKPWSRLTKLFVPTSGLQAQTLEKAGEELGLKLPQDIHDVTLYGTDYEGKTVTAILHGKIDPAKVVAKFKSEPWYQVAQYNGHIIHVTGNMGVDTRIATTMPSQKSAKPAAPQVAYATLLDDILIWSPSKKVLEAHLDFLDAKTKSLHLESTLASAPQAGVVVYVAGEGLANLPAEVIAQSPMLQRVKAAWLTLGDGSTPDNVGIHSVIVTQTPADAQQISMIFQGVKAAYLLSKPVPKTGQPDSTKPKGNTMDADALLNGLTVENKDDTLHLDWNVPVEAILAASAGTKPADGINFSVSSKVEYTNDASTQPASTTPIDHRTFIDIELSDQAKSKPAK